MWSSSQSKAQMSSNRVPQSHQNHQNRQKSQQIVYKYVKPSQPIYRPPSARVNYNRSGSPESHSSSTTSTSQSNETNKFINKSNNFGNTSKASDQQTTKGTVKRSKSCKEVNNNYSQETIAQLMSMDGISWESVTLVRRAIEKTNSLTMNQLMQIVRILCNKALEKSCYSRALAVICLTINEKQSETRNHLFIESLINCLREWFTERDKLRLTSGGARRWTAYVTFISELYLNLKTRNRPNNTKPYFNGQNDDSDDEYDLNPNRVRQNDPMSDKITNSLMFDKQQKQFSILLFDSMQAILMNANSTPTEIECLQSVLRSCGKYLEEDSPSRMKSLMFMIRETFLSPTSSPNLINCQKLFLEIIELSSSGWNFNQSQLIYYFPYTKQIDN